LNISPEVKYDGKQHHGLQWGFNRFVDDRMQIRDVAMGGSVVRVGATPIEQYDSTWRLLQFGNPWVCKDPTQRRFNHPNSIIPRVAAYYFWDNPELPHLLYRGSWNPRHEKSWMRIVPGGILSGDTPRLQHRVDSINQQLRILSGGAVSTWHDIVGPRRPVRVRGNRVLVILSSSGVYHHYSRLEKWTWKHGVVQDLVSRGYEVHVRDKVGRKNRDNLNEILAEDWAFTVSYQSACVMESVLAGTPAVTWNQRDCGGTLTTPYGEMLEGHIRECDEDAVDHRVECLFANTFHKQEAYTGEWYYGQ